MEQRLKENKCQKTLLQITGCISPHQVAAWFPYTVYAILVFLENSVMIVLWFMNQMTATSALPEEEQAIYSTHRERLILIHYGCFSFGVLMMILTFACAPPPAKQEEDEKQSTATSVTRVSKFSHGWMGSVEGANAIAKILSNAGLTGHGALYLKQNLEYIYLKQTWSIY